MRARDFLLDIKSEDSECRMIDGALIRESPDLR